jgi:hypothetical protein
MPAIRSHGPRSARDNRKMKQIRKLSRLNPIQVPITDIIHPPVD